MPNYTKTIQLEKPLQKETYDVDKRNANWDKIDAAIMEDRKNADKHSKNPSAHANGIAGPAASATNDSNGKKIADTYVYRETIAENTDANSLINKNCIYTVNVNSMKNMPTQFSGTLIVSVFGNANQIFIPYAENYIYKRYYLINSQIWTEWTKVKVEFADSADRADRADRADTLTTPRTIAIRGNFISGEATAFDGTKGIVIPVTLDPTLVALAGVNSSANTIPYFNGVDSASITALSEFARTILDDADASAVRNTIGANAENCGGIVAQLLNTTGYVKFANGLIVQWGYGTIPANNNTATVILPITYMTRGIVLVSDATNTASSVINHGAIMNGLNKFDVFTNLDPNYMTAPDTFSFISIGV